jgi:hypothetical protein
MASASLFTAHTAVPHARSASVSTCRTMSQGSTSSTWGQARTHGPPNQHPLPLRRGMHACMLDLLMQGCALPGVPGRPT